MAHEPRLPLAERLRPLRLDDVIGNARARSELQAWADRWKEGTPPTLRAAILMGPPGVGKTSSALALANDLGWSAVEMNASDARNEAAIERVAGRASVSHSLSEGPKGSAARRALIVLDEADSLSGRATESARPAPAPATLRDFLRSRYVSIGALNAAWGLTPKEKPVAFEGWEAVPRSPGNFAWARRPAARRDIEDWRGMGRPHDLSDRGGMAAIARLVRSTRQPLVLIVNDDRVLTRYAPVFRSGVVRIRFFPLRERELTSHLASIAREERIEIAPGVLESIARRCRGDLRAALNDLEAIAPLPAGPRQLELLGARDPTADLEAVVEEVLTAHRYYRSVEIRDRLDAPPDDLLPWIEENLPRFAPDPAHREAAFDHLAIAEELLARARRQRVWSQWSYASEILTGGVGLALAEAAVPPSGRAYFPGFLAEMGRSRSSRAVRDGIARKAGARFHVSRAKARAMILPFLEGVFRMREERRPSARIDAVRRGFLRELALNAEEVGVLLGVDPSSPSVSRLVEPLDAPREDPNDGGPDATAGSDTPGRRVQRHLSDFGSR